jgi:cell division protein FtsB
MSAFLAALQAFWAALRFAVGGGVAVELEALRREIVDLQIENADLRLDRDAARAENAQLTSDMEVVRANLEDIQRTGSGSVAPAAAPGPGHGTGAGADTGRDHAVLGRLRDGSFGT